VRNQNPISGKPEIGRSPPSPSRGGIRSANDR
jgi:hypothetical protein